MKENEETNESKEQPGNEEQEATKLLERLKVMAEQWRSRLADPILQRAIEAGQLVLSPLVKELLALFPPAGKK